MQTIEGVICREKNDQIPSATPARRKKLLPEAGKCISEIEKMNEKMKTYGRD